MKFIVYRNNRRLPPVELSQAVRSPHTFREVFKELDWIGFELEDARPDAEFTLFIGDNPVRQPPKIYRNTLVWPSDRYFANSFGRIRLRLRIRLRGGEPQEIFAGDLSCYSSKFTVDQYRKMLADISGIARGLIFDVVSNSCVIFGWGETSMVHEMSGLEEYAALERLILRFEAILDRISQMPDTAIEVRQTRQRCYGYENFSQRAISRMTASGFHPGNPNMPKPFPCEVRKKFISYDTWENRQIAGFCNIISSRLDSVMNSAREQKRKIRETRGWRKMAPRGQVSLWNLEDRPRIEQLDKSVDACHTLRERIDNYPKRFKFLEGLSPAELNLRPTPRFLRDLFYSHAYAVMTDFINSNGVLFDRKAFEHRVKDTAKLYEYWVYLLLYKYLSGRLGLRADHRRTLFPPRTDEDNIFVLNIESGSTAVFHTETDLRILLHYEPTFFPLPEARERKSRFYRSGLMENSLSLQPDIIIEAVTGPEKAPVSEYALVIDCKYSAKISGHHWYDVGKYQFQLFESIGHTNIARQLWLFYPGPHEGWKTNFPDPNPEHLISDSGAVAGEVSIAPLPGESGSQTVETLFDQLDKSVGAILRALLRSSGRR
ncbi:hypothetical protein DENIS_0711 [Desulfonema ishimotonii]|uniref:DUF2357 domain-containing protein n=1 Tax=Desulfonema ishimotonii TaxID=45657 RepID=A0A401FS47_9BACT|nr:DUF2357 domain-containing protein [Desulfonema ishimotonii]GBC59770.1 hypothetical protein DENIS_0711 [Desulfonema ishimotonii]